MSPLITCLFAFNLAIYFLNREPQSSILYSMTSLIHSSTTTAGPWDVSPCMSFYLVI